MKNLGIVMVLTGASAAVLFGGCGDLPGQRLAYDKDLVPMGGLGNIDTDGLFPQGQGVGDDCAAEDCRAGLSCNDDDVCEPSGSLGAQEACTIGPECQDGFHCQFGAGVLPSPAGCAPAGDGVEGDPCGDNLDLDCESGLRCGLNGFELVCVQPGEGDVGDPCVQHTNCYQGLYCKYPEGSEVGQCGYPELPVGIPLWAGVECPEQDDENVAALFNVPGADGTPDDATFFDHPYPSDIRIGDNGRPDLDGFPTPGPALLGVDMVQAYVDAVEDNTNGWSTNPTIYFRFTGAVDWESLNRPDDGENRVVFRDMETNRNLSTSWSVGSGSNYICDDWLAIKPTDGTLRPGATYAVWITTEAQACGVREAGEDSCPGGGDIERPEQFEAMLADSAPSDSGLADAYDAFAPLRDYIADSQGEEHEVDADSILIATVFTTDDPIEEMRDLADSVAAADLPTASDWVKCDGGNESPCAQAEDGRACGSGTSDYDEYQALLEVPIFQEGEAPYLVEGGGIASSVQRTEQICVSMSIPTDTAPAEGWPLVIYGHGTGGSYRGPIRESVAGALARSTPKFATLGFDEVQHGPRRGEGEGSDQDPEPLFFNFVNPDAGRGNPLQGAADILSILRWAEQGDLASAGDTGDAAISVDETKIFYFGHSQGSTHGSLAVPFSSMVGSVLSGNGGGLADALMNKTNPIDIAGAIPFALQDQDDQGNLRLGNKHPVLSLLQHYIDPADPINFGPLMTVRPEEGQTPKHTFMTFGLDDTYSPPATLAHYYNAAELALAEHGSGVNPTGDNLLRDAPATDPVTDNFSLDMTTFYTAVARQYNPANGSDGHFVVHDVQEANDDAIGFLESLANGTPPVVPVQ